MAVTEERITIRVPEHVKNAAKTEHKKLGYSSVSEMTRTALLKEIGLDTIKYHHALQPRRSNDPVSDDELLEELRAANDALGRAPTAGEMNELGEYHASTYVKHFDSWTNALREAGLFVSDWRDYRPETTD